ncbi:NAD-P-binding protein [Cytidiella melzeri]|nr:NAD-P-binding protein [Cytidiella melzeri]
MTLLSSLVPHKSKTDHDNMSTLPLQGKVALVTGSSRAIGAAMVKRLATDGASVVVNYNNNADAANAVVDEIHSSTSGKAVALKGDMSSTVDAQNLVEETVKHFGKIDIIVLNAGTMTNAPLNDIDEKAFDDLFNMNVKVPLFMVKTASKHMQPGGRVLFISSSITKFSGVPPNYLLYAATKGAIEQLTRVLAKDLGSRGINVNAIAPGPTNTELFRAGKSEQLIQFFSSLHPAKRIAEPDEISPIIAMLAREESSWVNGQTIFVNGGYAL